MTTLSFPDSPLIDDTHTFNGKTFKWNGTQWISLSTTTSKNLSALDQPIIPEGNEQVDLGTSEKRFKDLYLSGNTIHLGDKTFSNSDILPFDLTVEAEVLTIAADSPDAGPGQRWLWSWNAGSVPYGRVKIDQIEQNPVALYLDSIYTVYNFAAHEIHANMTQTHKLYLKWIEGAGTDNLVPWAANTLNVANISFPGVNGGNETEVQRLIIDTPVDFSVPTLNAPTVGYTVEFQNAGAYTFIGKHGTPPTGAAEGDNPTLGPMYRGGTYTFAIDAVGHPLYLTTDDGTNFVSESYVGEYTNGVTGSRTDNGTLTFVVPNDAPDTLYYQCGIHGSMRGEIVIKDLAIEYREDGNPKLWFQHSQEGHAVEVDLRPKPVITDQVTLVYDGTSDSFIPQDMGVYLDRTVQFQTKLQDLVAEKITADGLVTASDVNNEVLYNITLAQQGDLQVVNGTARWYAPFGLTVTDIRPRLGTAGDSDININIKVNGTVTKSITMPADSDSTTVSSPSFTMSEGQYITVDVTSIGSETIGADLFLQFTYKKN